MSIRSGDVVELWDVHDIQRPKRLNKIQLSPDPDDTSMAPDGLVFLDEHTLGVVVGDDLRLWDVRDPRHPKPRGDPMPNVAGDEIFYLGSRHLLTTDDPAGGPSTVLWDLSDPDHPVNLSAKGQEGSHRPSDLNIQSNTVFPVTDRILAGVTTDSSLIQFWDTSDPTRPSVVASFPANAAVPGLLSGSPDGQYLAGPGRILDNDQQIWHITGTNEPNVEDFGDIPADEIEFSPNSRVLVGTVPVTLSESRVLSPHEWAFVVWPLDIDPLYQQLCATIRGATDDEHLRQYLPRQYYKPACT